MSDPELVKCLHVFSQQLQNHMTCGKALMTENFVTMGAKLQTGKWFSFGFELIPPWCCIYASVNCVSIGSGNGWWPVWHQAITWNNAGVLSTGLLGMNFNKNQIGILSFSFEKMHLKLSSAKVAPILSRGDELIYGSSWTILMKMGNVFSYRLITLAINSLWPSDAIWW